MIPDQFREFDRVARESFSFLIRDRGCSEPTVEYWRDYYLAYEPPSDVKISVGTERGMGPAGWLGVFINIAYRGEGHVLFFLDDILGKLGVPTEAGKQGWPKSIQEYAAIFDTHFERIVDYVRARGVERARQGPESGPPESGLVVRGADGSAAKTTCAGAGVHFWGSRYLPIDREPFWKIVDKGYLPSYVECRCPSCGYVGNVGQRQAGSFALIKAVKTISFLIVLVSMVGCAVIGSWRESDFSVPVTVAAVVVWAVSRFAEAKLVAASGFTAWCPHCGCESNEFAVEGQPPTIDDRVNPLRFGK